jgi:Asp-tRNA(Asn)/Glu-tRNA(Gln) amidotransferase C subunit
MPSLILYIDENIKQSLDQNNLQPIEKTIIEIILHELDATKDNCQITWIKTNILTSDYKIFGEMKFRQKKSRNKNKKENCLKKIGNVLHNYFKVPTRLRAFSIEDASITSLDIKK